MELCSGKLRFLGTPGLVVDICSMHKHFILHRWLLLCLLLAIRKNCTLGSELGNLHCRRGLEWIHNSQL